MHLPDYGSSAVFVVPQTKPCQECAASVSLILHEIILQPSKTDIEVEDLDL